MNKTITTCVIDWLEKHDYSLQHWDVVAKELLEHHQNSVALATSALAENLKTFHQKYQDAVVKPDNLLYDLLSLNFKQVNWVEVAESQYKRLNITP